MKQIQFLLFFLSVISFLLSCNPNGEEPANPPVNKMIGLWYTTSTVSEYYLAGELYHSYTSPVNYRPYKFESDKYYLEDSPVWSFDYTVTEEGGKKYINVTDKEKKLTKWELTFPNADEMVWVRTSFYTYEGKEQKVVETFNWKRK